MGVAAEEALEQDVGISLEESSDISTEEVADTLRWAAANDIGVLPVGSAARTAPPRRDGRFVVLSTDRLTGMEIYEPADVTLTAKGGTPLEEISDALRAHRQWLPFDPPGAAGRTLAGLVATGESGPVATGYGELRNHVLGATVVCGDGRVLRLGGRVVKDRLLGLDEEHRAGDVLPEAGGNLDPEGIGAERRVQRIVLEAVAPVTFGWRARDCAVP